MEIIEKRRIMVSEGCIPPANLVRVVIWNGSSVKGGRNGAVGICMSSVASIV